MDFQNFSYKPLNNSNFDSYEAECNHLNYDFMEEILKMNDVFNLNLQSIFICYEIFFKFELKGPFGGLKTAKMGKNTFFNLLNFHHENAK